MSTQDWGKNGPLSKAIQARAGLSEVRKAAVVNTTAKMFALGERNIHPRVPGYNPGQREIFGRRRDAHSIDDTLRKDAATAVRKDDAKGAHTAACDFIEKAADSLPEDEVDPVQVLSIAQRSLLDTFRKAEGRDPGAGDSGYWQVYAAVLSELKDEVVRQEATS